MTPDDHNALRQLDTKLRQTQKLIADWLQPGVLTSGEAQERLIEIMDDPKLMLAQAVAKTVLAEHVEEAFG